MLHKVNYNNTNLMFLIFSMKSKYLISSCCIPRRSKKKNILLYYTEPNRCTGNTVVCVFVFLNNNMVVCVCCVVPTVYRLMEFDLIEFRARQLPLTCVFLRKCCQGCGTMRN